MLLYTQPILDYPPFAVTIPSTTVHNIPLLEKTIKIATIARYLAIFRVKYAIVYKDPFDKNFLKNANLIKKILEYAETPPYLRKILFKLDPDLRYAGLIPPLKIPSHQPKVPLYALKEGHVREGVVVYSGNNYSLVDIGLQEKARINKRLQKGRRVTVVIKRVNRQIFVDLVDKQSLKIYWGYKVILIDNLREFIEKIKRKKWLVVATSKYGVSITQQSDTIKKALVKSQGVLLLFGSPERGLYPIAEKLGFSLESFSDFIVNTVPHQGTETIRVEEAVGITLSILNFLKYT